MLTLKICNLTEYLTQCRRVRQTLSGLEDLHTGLSGNISKCSVTEVSDTVLDTSVESVQLVLVTNQIEYFLN